MRKLNRELLRTSPPPGVRFGSPEPLPEKVLQFGEGNFLRAFADAMIDELNITGGFGGGIVVVQPLEKGLVDALNAQDGLYTVILRGLENGLEVDDRRIVTSVTRGINPYSHYDEFIGCAEKPELRVIISNTTEAGIAFSEADRLSDTPQASFPGKVAAFLYRRWRHFGGDPSKGLIIIPCELIEDNAAILKNVVLRLAALWELEEGFTEWLENANSFVGTLVDRIVTGYPRDEAEALTEQLDYEDSLLDTAEVFHFWVLEGPEELARELPFGQAGMNVVWTENAAPYKARKVRILNGAHTASVLAAFLAGHDTVAGMMGDPVFEAFVRGALFEEVIPTLLKYLPYDDLKMFADSVFDRFLNPYIKHYLLSISLNSVSKLRARVLPSILDYVSEKGELPGRLCFSMAALINFYAGSDIEDGALIGTRGGEPYRICDEAGVLEFFRELRASSLSNAQLAERVAGNADFWGVDLNGLDGFTGYLAECLDAIDEYGIRGAVERI